MTPVIGLSSGTIAAIVIDKELLWTDMRLRAPLAGVRN